MTQEQAAHISDGATTLSGIGCGAVEDWIEPERWARLLRNSPAPNCRPTRCGGLSRRTLGKQ